MTTTTVTLTPRQRSIVSFALFNFINSAHERANAAAQDKEGRFSKPGDAESFLRDAKDAEEIRALLSEASPTGQAVADVLSELRAAGLSVAVHNDYRINGEAHTFWLFTRADGMSFKGEGKTDADALAQVRASLATPTPQAQQQAEAVRDAERVLALLDTGDWLLTKHKPWDALTDEANVAQAWSVKRLLAPFCDRDRRNTWTGPTAIAAFDAAISALGLPPEMTR